MHEPEQKPSIVGRQQAPKARPVAPIPSQPCDDDAVIAPPPPLEVFLPKHPRRAKPGRDKRIASNLRLRRTLIPLLLTNGLLLPTLGVLWFATEPESPFRRSGAWLPVTLIGLGVILLCLGIANAMYARSQLPRRPN